jgi:D-amino-acid dehydrogenase
VDVVVIGAGAVGLSCALELSRAGAQVTVLETAPALALGCSSGNAGLVCPSHAAPLASLASLRLGLRSIPSREGPLAIAPRLELLPWLVRFTAASMPARERAATETMRALAQTSHQLHGLYSEQLGTGLTPRGTLDVYETEAGLERGAAHAPPPVEVLTAKEARAIEPALAEGIAGAIFHPGELSGDPAEFVHAVGAAVREAGVDVRLETEALRLDVAGGRIAAVETTHERLEPGTVVLAAGAWNRGLARTAGLFVPVEGGKGYHIDYEPSDADPRIPVFVSESRIAVSRLPGRLRLTGVLALHGLDLSVDERRVAAVERVGAQRIAGLRNRRRLEVWRGLRPCSPDGLPIIGSPEACANLVVATGHGMLGFSLAPVTGRLVAQLVSGSEPQLDVAALHPDRFRPLIRRARSSTHSRAR